MARAPILICVGIVNSVAATDKVHGRILADLFHPDSDKSRFFESSRRGSVLRLHESVHSFTFGACQHLADSRFDQRDSQPDSSLLFRQTEVQFRLTALKIKADLSKRNSLLVFSYEQEASVLANFLRKPHHVSFPRNRSR